MITREFAERFAADWIESWNEHDVDRVLAHYTDGFEMSSPKIIKIVGESSGVLKGKNDIGAYWFRALELEPNLHFELISTLIGVDSITLYYNGVHGATAEVLHFNQNGKVIRAYAHYL